MSSKSEIAVSVRGLSKSYTIAREQEKHNTLAESMISRLKNPLKRPKRETFWALKDIEFDIKKGDLVGIIGRNGAGKSTLLKILSRITEPTTGQIDLYGRVGSLLEVGTGFSGELTGRENIYLNGSILGMSKVEIRKQFDAIVDFAGVEHFLDTPVKRYSSGMYVRLAFAVAAHLRAEIMIVDEVLAVGDAEFQKRCIGKLKDVSTNGRTVLFVSHNLESISTLCTDAILLERGIFRAGGTIRHVLELYTKDLMTDAANGAPQGRRGVSSKLLHIAWVKPIRRIIPPDTRKEFICKIASREATGGRFHIALHIYDNLDREITILDSALVEGGNLEVRERFVSFTMRSPWLRPGNYRIDAYLYANGLLDTYRDAARFSVSTEYTPASGLRVAKSVAGCVVPDFSMNLHGPEATFEATNDVV